MSGRVHIPTYRRHKQSGQGVVTLTDGLGGCHDVLLGKYGTVASRQAYSRAIAEWECSGRRLPPAAATGDLCSNELALAYYRWPDGYHAWTKHNGQASALRDALRMVKELYGATFASEFGRLALKSCRGFAGEGAICILSIRFGQEARRSWGEGKTARG